MNFIIDLVIYPFDVIVSIGETNEQFEKTLNNIKDFPKKEIENPLLYDEFLHDAINAMFSEGPYGLIRMFNKPGDSS